jgi:hypothetical protein
LRFGPKDFAFVLGAIQRIYWAHMGRELVVTTLAATDPIHPHLNLNKPPGWVLKLEPLRPRKFLERLMADQQNAYQRHVEEVHDEFIRIKNELRHALESARNQQYDRMVRQCALYVQRLAEKDEQVQLLRAELDRARPHVLDTNAARGVDRALAVTDPTFVAHDPKRLAALSAAGAPSDGASSPSPGRYRNSSSGANNNNSDIGGEDPEHECLNCTQLRRLLEAHPSDDKRRVLGAEEAARGAQREVDRARALSEPLLKDIEMLRDAVSKADSILLDQRLSLADRVRGAAGHTTPHALLAKSKQAKEKGALSPGGGGQPMNAPPVADVPTLTSEVLTLRGVLRDASAQHMAEMQRLRDEFDAYDAAMVAAVRLALESSGIALVAGSARDKAEGVVANERERVLRLLKADRQAGGGRGASPSRAAAAVGGGGGGRSSSAASQNGFGGGSFGSPLHGRSAVLQSSVAGYGGGAGTGTSYGMSNASMSSVVGRTPSAAGGGGGGARSFTPGATPGSASRGGYDAEGGRGYDGYGSPSASRLGPVTAGRSPGNSFAMSPTTGGGGGGYPSRQVSFAGPSTRDPAYEPANNNNGSMSALNRSATSGTRWS